MKRWWTDLEGEHKWLLVGVVLMWVSQIFLFISPVDHIPDLVPVLGLVDDVVRFAVAIALTAYAARQLGPQPFAGLMPAALRSSSLSEPASHVYEETTPEHEDIPGYRPLSMAEIRSL